jgi:hypothetical protein
MTKIEKLEALAALVGDMRQAQKNYFKTRAFGALAASKELEKKVDVALDELDNETLFDRGRPLG